MMNYPGVLAGDPVELAKLAAFAARGLLIDGHAPGVVGADAAGLPRPRASSPTTSA